MQSPLKRILTGVLFLVATVIIAVAGYRLAGWSLLDSLYMVVITTFGVGYGEVRPINTPALKIFTMLVIIGGTSSTIYLVGGFVQMITEGEINHVLGKRRMTRTIETLTNHIIICGFGRMGQILARQLIDSKIPFIVIDADPIRLEKAEEMGCLVRLGNATDETVLQAVGIDRAKVLSTVLPDDAANVFITLTAREMNPNLMILARGELPSTEKKLRLAGADQVVLPATISGLRMAHMITHPATLDFFNQDDGRTTLNELLSQLDIQVDEVAIAPNSPMVGSTIGDVEVRSKGTFIIVAIRRADGTTITHPPQSALLIEGDVVIVLGHRGDTPQFVKKFVVKDKMLYRGSRVRERH
ncbi:potassium channel family protein [Myxacorys almedinensis]|uniref:Potassium channel protein n=1 Tax=Myxacorys almedinensis A TaxID=2690445 RepID=A0A8J8CI94_9CYAN|nr:potassium channel protein [Myxacorys almedinensis]NDJ17508.1 potassium channel protein [Myxacorys almedinensis A]